MAAVLLFWNPNMAAMTSCENALFTHSLIHIDYKNRSQCGMKNESYYASNPSFLLYNMLTLTFTVYSSPMYWAVTFIRGTFGDTNSSIYAWARMTMILI